MADLPDGAVEALYEDRTVPELRDMCSEHGVERERGASKAETARAIAEQAPEAAAEAAGVELEEPGFTVMCPCGHEGSFDEARGAVEAAKSHASSCREGLGVGGLGGLNVWDDEKGARVWRAGGGEDPAAMP